MVDEQSEDFFRAKPLRNAGLFLGIGMGGFIDGILFHQIFQLHNMLSSKYFPDTLVNEQINMVWDGFFHVFTWIFTAIGISMLWNVAKTKSSPLNTKLFVGSLLMGAGLFNFVEGVIDHQILQIHHVVERAFGAVQIFWDMVFVASGAIMLVIGFWLYRCGVLDLKSKNNL